MTWYWRASMLPLLDAPELAAMFTHLGIVLSRMEDRGINEKPDTSPLPRGVLTCGEAWHFVSVLFALLAQMHPALQDPDQLSELLAVAMMNDAGGRPN